MNALVILVLLIAMMGCTTAPKPTPDTVLRHSIDAELAPRSLLLTGGDLDSHSGRYMITFPPPNECVILGPIPAQSRSFALYSAVSEGGFALKASKLALTVWTIEEWESLKKVAWYADFVAHRAQVCKESPQDKVK